MSNVSVLDASAVLASLKGEKGEDRVDEALDAGPCYMTSVNLCEVLGKLCDWGMALPQAKSVVDDLGIIVTDFDSELAAVAAGMRARTRAIGASLGDLACLALAHQTHGATVITAERDWAKLKWPFKVVVIR